MVLGSLLAVAATPAPTHGDALPAPPAQPADGPGGAAAAHRGVTTRRYGSGGTAYWLFEPARPTPGHAPLIVFLHGWSALQPAAYRAWIDHLVKRGNVVVYPIYQEDLRTPVFDFTGNAIAAVGDAVRRLDAEPGHVRVEPGACAIVGHSMGGTVAANVAVRWRDAGIPRPKAIMCVEPGKTWARSERIAITIEDLRQIPADTLLLTVVGDRDVLARDVDAKRIFRETTAVPPANKNYLVVHSDEHGAPALVASHLFPVGESTPVVARADEAPAGGPIRRWVREHLGRRLARGLAVREAAADTEVETPRGTDALDYFGTWKWLDALTDAAFRGEHREYALGNTPEQRFMGVWSDGVAVKEASVTAAP